MITFKRTDSNDENFLGLIKELDAYLEERHGEQHSVCKQYNKPESIQFVLIGYNTEGKPIACGAIRKYSQGVMEVKRMFVSPNEGGKGIAKMTLKHLERWAIELGCKKCILETGNKLPEAIALYQKSNYRQIPNYGQYELINSSICFKKELTSHDEMKTQVIEIKETKSHYIQVINDLLFQLTSSEAHFTEADLKKIVESPNSRLFFIYYDATIAGMLTLGSYISPTGEKYWIEDVVVDNKFRGKSLGKQLVEYAIDYIRKHGKGTLMLTSNPARIAANMLYQSVGFQAKETNVYRMSIEKMK